MPSVEGDDHGNSASACTVILVAGKVRPVPTVAVQFRDSRLPAGMLRLVEVEIPVVPKPAQVSIKRFVQERTEELVARLRLEAPGFANAPAHKLRKVLGSLLVATVREEEDVRAPEGNSGDVCPNRHSFIFHSRLLIFGMFQPDFALYN